MRHCRTFPVAAVVAIVAAALGTAAAVDGCWILFTDPAHKHLCDSNHITTISEISVYRSSHIRSIIRVSAVIRTAARHRTSIIVSTDGGCSV
jgi:hypothetical protein